MARVTTASVPPFFVSDNQGYTNGCYIQIGTSNQKFAEERRNAFTSLLRKKYLFCICLSGCQLELGTCVLASTRRCDLLVLVLALFQTTCIEGIQCIQCIDGLKLNGATNNREYSRVHRFPALVKTSSPQ